MSKKAMFRALREECGLSQLDIAKELDVKLSTVKAWEKPQSPKQPPEAVFSLFGDILNNRIKLIDEVMSKISDIDGDFQLNYYRSQKQYVLLGRDKGCFGVANANARAVARRLYHECIDVEFSYPDDDSNVYHNARKE